MNYDPEMEMTGADRVSGADAPDIRPTGLVTPNGQPLRYGKPIDPNEKPRFRCPPLMRSHVARVLDHEYETGVELVRPRVLDIGANLGAFAIWAGLRWPGAAITCYEPHPDTYKLLIGNVARWPVGDCRMEAVSAREEPRVLLNEGLHNCGEASLLMGPEQKQGSAFEVKNTHASKLPPCDVLKVDAEGVELEVFKAYAHLDTCKLVLMEAHGKVDREKLCELFEDVLDGWVVALDKRTMPDRWTMGYRRKADNENC